MFKLQRTHLLVLISFQLLASLALGQQVTCDPNNRPTAGSCGSQPFKGVCGYTHANCPLDICGNQFDKECLACANPNVDYYTIGPCPEEVRILTCNYVYCPNTERNTFSPVCEIRTENGQTVTETHFNYCDLCQANNVKKYTVGVCPKDRELCTPGKLGCTRERDTCAWVNFPNVGRIPTTTSSIAEACEDEDVAFYTKGACGPLVNDERYCLPNNRPTECDGENDPVCGFTHDGQFLQHEIMPSSCAACANPDVIYWLPGPCVFKCNLDEEYVTSCTGVIVPACGTYIDNGVEKKVSLRNDCIGCYDGISKRILTWTDGLCPGDQGIRCENDSRRTGGGQVCGYKTETCSTAACRTTYASARNACLDTSVLWYKPGAC